MENTNIIRRSTKLPADTNIIPLVKAAIGYAQSLPYVTDNAEVTHAQMQARRNLV